MRNTPEAWDERAALPTTWEPALWSEHSQAVRFARVRDLLSEVASGAETLLDFGCGTGALADWLHLDEQCGGLWYSGYDWSPAMRDRARRDHPASLFTRFEILERVLDDDVFDHVVCLGPFNLSHNWSRTDTFDTLRGLWNRTSRSLTVSLYMGRELPGMIRYGHQDAVRLVELLGFPRATITTEHLPNDLIVRLRRERHRDGAPAELPAGDVGRLEAAGV